jgi:hypothetical protein
MAAKRGRSPLLLQGARFNGLALVDLDALQPLVGCPLCVMFALLLDIAVCGRGPEAGNESTWFVRMGITFWLFVLKLRFKPDRQNGKTMGVWDENPGLKPWATSMSPLTGL